MVKRRDGKQTRQKLLDVACQEFVAKGFREAKITDICRRAGANVAAVNYYFGDKESLYVAAWQQTLERFISADPPPPAAMPPEARFRFAIQRIMRRLLLDDSGDGCFRRLELMELANPTGLIGEIWNRLIAPRRQVMRRMIRDIGGADLPDDAVLLCEMSIINQCRGYLLLQKGSHDDIFAGPPTLRRVDQIAEHITRFSIAGILAIRDQLGRSGDAPAPSLTPPADPGGR